MLRRRDGAEHGNGEDEDDDEHYDEYDDDDNQGFTSVSPKRPQ